LNWPRRLLFNLHLSLWQPRFFSGFSTVQYTISSSGDSSDWVINVEADCAYPQAFWGGIICENAEWTSNNTITVYLPDYVSTSSPTVHVGTLSITTNVTVTSQLTVSSLVLNPTSALTIDVSTANISVCSALLDGIVNITGTQQTSGEIPILNLNSNCGWSGTFSKVYVNGAEVECFQLVQRLTSLLVSPCNTGSGATAVTDATTGIVVGCLGGALVIGILILLVVKRQDLMVEQVFKVSTSKGPSFSTNQEVS